MSHQQHGKKPSEPISLASSGKQEVKKSPTVWKAENSQAAKREKIKLTSLYEFIKPLYANQKLNKSFKEAFVSISAGASGTFAPFSLADKEELLKLAQDRDSDHKITLELAEFLLEKRGSPTLREYLLSHVEYLVSHTGNLSALGKTSIFQSWANVEDLQRYLDLFCDQIDKIKDGVDAKGQPKALNEKTSNNLKCIAAIWLYLKGKVNFQNLIEQLSGRAFNLKGQSCNEPIAVGFIARMVGSTKKYAFAHYLHYQKNYEQALRTEIDRSKSEKLHQNEQIFRHKSEIEQLKEQLAKAEVEKEQLSETISSLEQQLENTKTEASHKSVHQRDETKQLRGKLIHMLEDNMLVNLKSALAANSRKEPKTRVVGIKLEDLIEDVRNRIEWLRK